MDIYEIIGKIIAAFFVGVIFYLAPKVKEWLETTADKTENDAIISLINSFTQAAEQLFHDDDPSGKIRKQYVEDQLKSAGVLVDKTISDMIEGAVWNINNQNKKAGV